MSDEHISQNINQKSIQMPSNYWSASCTVLTYDKRIGKRYLYENSKVKSVTGGNGFEGSFVTRAFTSMEQLCAVQDALNLHQCLIAGTSTVDAECGRLGNWEDRCHERTKEWFPEPFDCALVTIDIDREGAPASIQQRVTTAKGVAELLFDVVPEARCAALLVRPSSSNGVLLSDGRPLKPGGWHAHLIAPPDKRVQVLERIYAAFARAGFAWIIVSAAPGLLKRNPVDLALRSSNQPIFSAPPIVEAPLRLERPTAFVQEGCVFDPNWLTSEGPEDVYEIYEALKKVPDIHAELDAAIKAKAEALVPVDNPNRKQTVAEQVLKLQRQATAYGRGYLGPDFRITLENGMTVTVAEVLQNLQRYHLERTLTPGEEEYRDGAQTGIIYTDRLTAVLHTQAHGGTTYTLLPFDSEQLTLRQLSKPAPVSDPLPPEEVEQQLRNVIRLWPDTVRTMGLKATQGIGKTDAVLRLMAERVGLQFLFLAANLRQCQQVYDDYCALAGSKGVALCRGRGAPDPDVKGRTMCTEPLRCERALAIKRDVNLSVAACVGCPSYDTCGYQKQAARFREQRTAPHIIFAAHDYAHYPLPGGWEPDAVIIDEMLRTCSVDEETSTPAEEISLNEWRDPASALVAHNLAAEHLNRTELTAIKAYRLRGEVLEAMAEQKVYYLLNEKWIAPRFRPFVHSQKPLLVIDGTLRKDLLEIQTGRKFDVYEINAERNLILIQALGNEAGSRAAKTAFVKNEVVKTYLASLPAGRCLFTYKPVRKLLGKGEEESCGHFGGDIRGSNAFKNFKSALIYGRLQLPEAVAVGRARVLAEASNLPPPNGVMEWVEHTVTDKRGVKLSTKYLRHTDLLVQSIIEAEREDEIEQSIDRLRLVWHKGEPKVVIVVNNLPLTLQPDYVLDWADVRDGRAASPAMHATLTGLVPGSPHQGPTLRPDIWRSKTTAENHFAAQLKPNWKDWFERLLVVSHKEGVQRRRAVEAYYRPADCAYTKEYLKLVALLNSLRYASGEPH